MRIAGAGALLVAAAGAAAAQDGNAIGNPQLRDFQLQPQRRIVTAPVPAPAPPPVANPPVVAPPRPAAPAPQNNLGQTPPPQTAQPQTAQPRPDTARPAPAPTGSRATPRQAPPASLQNVPAPPASGAPPPVPAPGEPVLPATPLPETAPLPGPPQGGLPWLYVLPAALVALAGAAFLLRRRRRGVVGGEVADAPAAAPLASPPPPPPVLRPWLELAVKVEKASATLTETLLSFELDIANTGKAAARNLRVDVKMFNAGAEQDREIGAFFQTAGRETTKLNLPGIAAGNSGIIRGEVAMKRGDMRALVLEDKYLFVPVLAVNVLYDWGQGRTGQSSKSYVVGRELAQPSEKMGAFRVDQGPRVWRTVGQRPHTMALRV